jgi:translation initiation factor IF-3
MDYGKFKFDEAQRAKESRRKANNFGIKEMKYRPKIGNGDFDTKTRQVVKFLHEGHKVKITVMFRGREVFHSELGKKILDRIAEQVDGMARIESEARLDGKNMVMVLAPDRRALQATAAKAQNESVAEASGALVTAPVVEAPAAAPVVEAPPAAPVVEAPAAAPVVEAPATVAPLVEAPAAAVPVAETLAETLAETPAVETADAGSAAGAASLVESAGANGAAIETTATKE